MTTNSDHAPNAGDGNHNAAQVEGQVQGSVQGGGEVTLSPEVKQAIADEVQRQLQAQQAAAQNPQAANGASGEVQGQVPPALDPNTRMFIVSNPLSVDVNGQNCALTSGDVITRIDDTPDANQNVKVLVSSSQKGDCSAGTQIPVAVNDLQDMHNAFREKIDDGLKTLADNQGKNGLPASPSTATTTNANAQASPDMDAAQDLQGQQKDADDAEKEVAQSQSSNGGGN